MGRCMGLLSNWARIFSQPASFLVSRGYCFFERLSISISHCTSVTDGRDMNDDKCAHFAIESVFLAYKGRKVDRRCGSERAAHHSTAILWPYPQRFLVSIC